MPLLRVAVQIGGSSPLEDTEANRQRIFVFGTSAPTGAGFSFIAGNLEARVPTEGKEHFDVRRPYVPSAIAVSAYAYQTFNSEDLTELPSLIHQLATAMERGYIIVTTNADPGTPLTRTDLLAYLV